jgi:RHS repeat-associated protein
MFLAYGDITLHSDRVPITIRRFMFIHSGLSGPVAATDVEGDVLWRRTYEPFGGDDLFEGNEGYKESFEEGTGLVNLGFVARQFDVDVGLYQLGHRWYDPESGRFVSIDPILSSLNVY